MMIFLLLFYFLFFATAMVLPTWRVWKMTGVNPLVLPRSDDAAGFVGKMFKLVIAALGLYLLLASLGLTKPISPIQLTDLARIVGWGLLAISLIWVLLAQFQMGRSWRIGIDTAVSTDLVIKGLFKFSRNPIFLGMMVQLLGLFLLSPDAVTLSVMVASFILISVQIRLEEQHLTALHKEAYVQYRNSVRRWL
jgi:protein-S-isoprenylcysteine O-methyltransferase Ste14